MPLHSRQGDLLFVQQETRPETDLTPRQGDVIVSGEATGHAHRLTPEQAAEVRRFAQARLAAQLSTEPVDEPETERLLQQAYVVAGLRPPLLMVWLDGPLPLVALRPRQASGTA
jgi:hypothetical protein